MEASPMLAPRQPGFGLAIFFGRLCDHRFRQFGAGRGFVPLQGLQVVPDELLVKARRADPRTVLISRPETGRVRCQHLVYQVESAGRVLAEFKLGIGNNDPLGQGKGRTFSIDLQADVPYPRGQFLAQDLLGLCQVDVFVVIPDRCLG